MTAMLWASDVVTPIIAPLLPDLRNAFLGGGAVAIGIGVTVWALKKSWLLFKDLIGNDRVRDMTWDYAGRIADMDARMAGLEGDLMQGHSESEWGGSVTAESAAENASGWEGAAQEDSGGGWDRDDAAALAASQDAAASSYLDRYRQSG